MANTDNETNAAAAPDELRFGFGANWADYVEKNFSSERVEISKNHLLGFLKLDSLVGKTFLDIGCGSGLHSLAAWRAGAARVVSFDYDRNSVATTKKLHELSGGPDNWCVMHGSVLDKDFMNSLPKSDVVYSWGVLHHTGSMWEAVRNAASCLHDKSVFYIALYSKDAYVSPPYDYWLSVKREYNHAGVFKKKWMEWRYALNDLGPQVVRGKNPFAHIRNYKKTRGMSYWHDIKDWLGGYPMEFAGNKETEHFAREELGLELIFTKAGEGNTEFLFRPMHSSNYWDEVIERSVWNDLVGPYVHLSGHAWIADLPESPQGEGERLMLYEDSSPIGWPNASLAAIEKWGGGRYRIEGRKLIFSATDNTDPNRPGRIYGFRAGFVS